MNPLEKGLIIAGIVLGTTLAVQKESKFLKNAGACLLTIGLGYCIGELHESEKNYQTKPKDFQLHQTGYLNQIIDC